MRELVCLGAIWKTLGLRSGGGRGLGLVGMGTEGGWLVVILLMLLANALLWLWGILPVYYQPFLD